MYILRVEVKQHVSASYGRHQVPPFKVSLYKLRNLKRKKNWWWPYEAETCFTSNLRIYIFYI